LNIKILADYKVEDIVYFKENSFEAVGFMGHLDLIFDTDSTPSLIFKFYNAKKELIKNN